MTRVPGVDPSAADGYVGRIFEAQKKRWGAPLLNHRVYARRPTIFRGAHGMWAGLDQSGLLQPALVALVNRRVAGLNGCVF